MSSSFSHGHRAGALALAAAALLALSAPAAPAQCRPHIVITGYWPPTNEMVRAWSADPLRNPGGWIGEDWAGRGYDVFAYFPEFPGGANMNPKGNGTFEVDYQYTSDDWWTIIPAHRPIAIVTFSRAGNNSNWEVEPRYKRFATTGPLGYIVDYEAPFKPTPGLPIVDLEAVNTIRLSSLPMDDIVDAVLLSGANVTPLIPQNSNFGGAFLSGYIGYHGAWWRDLHSDPTDPMWCVAAGHVHVGGLTALPAAVQATEATLHAVIDHLDAVVPPPCPGDINRDGVVDQVDLGILLSEMNCYGSVANCLADLNCDGVVDQSDLGILLASFGLNCP